VAAISSEATLRRSFTQALEGERAAFAYDDWRSAFLAARGDPDARRLLVIDEYPYLAGAVPGVGTVLQAVWDEVLESSRLMVVLCGFHIGMMEREAVSYRAPLFGRSTGADPSATAAHKGQVGRRMCDTPTMTAPLAESLSGLCRENGDTALYVYGSRAAEIAARVTSGSLPAEHPGSDVDIGVEPRRGHGLAARRRVLLVQQLEDLFDVDRVDLCVLPEAQLYYLRRAADLAPFLREQWREKVGTEL